MKKQILIFVLMAAIATVAYSVPDTLWTKEYGGSGHDHFRSVQETSDGGYIAVGHTRSFGAGFWDVYLVKINHLGDTTWTRTFGGTDIDKGYCVQQTFDDGYIIAGATRSFGAGNYDFYVIKTDGNGNSVWTRTLGGVAADEARFVRQTMDGGYVVIGWTTSMTEEPADIYLVKLDTNGNTVWTRTYGGNDEDKGYCVQPTLDGGLILAGYTESYGAGGSDFYLIKTDMIGAVEWTHTYGGSADDEAYSVQQTLDEGYVMAGYTKSYGAGGSDFYVVKTDSLGNVIWDGVYGGTSNDVAYSIAEAASGSCGYIVVGYKWTNALVDNVRELGEEDIYIIRLNCNGSICWERVYGGESNEAAFDVYPTSDGGYIIAAYKYSNQGPSKAWLLKMEPDMEECDCDYAFSEQDQGDIDECNYPTLAGNPAHALTYVAWLGDSISGDLAPNALDMDTFDDGVVYQNPPWSPCGTVSVEVTVTGGINYFNYSEICDGLLYLNGWKDGNLDGDFDDVLCEGRAPEWIVQDEIVTPGIHTFYFTDPGVFEIGIYDGVFRWRLTSEPVGQYGFGMVDNVLCPYMENGTYGFNYIGEVEDYVIEDIQLSVELISFEAISGDGNVRLQWSTESELNNDHFILYRKIAGSSDFAHLAIIPGSGTSSQTQDYTYVDYSVVNGVTYDYRLADVDINGVETTHDIIVSATPMGDETIPVDYALHQNYPNPFNATTLIRFDIKEQGLVQLIIYDLLGREVATLVNEELDAKSYSISWDASGLSSGIYFCKLNTGNFTAARKLLFLK